MKITVKQEFLHERDRFLVDEVREVPDELAEYFISHGWAEGPEGHKPATEPLDPPDNVTLEVHNITHETKSKVKAT